MTNTTETTSARHARIAARLAEVTAADIAERARQLAAGEAPRPTELSCSRQTLEALEDEALRLADPRAWLARHS